jgi:hypothetical protein
MIHIDFIDDSELELLFRCECTSVPRLGELIEYWPNRANREQGQDCVHFTVVRIIHKITQDEIGDKSRLETVFCVLQPKESE